MVNDKKIFVNKNFYNITQNIKLSFKKIKNNYTFKNMILSSVKVREI